MRKLNYFFLKFGIDFKKILTIILRYPYYFIQAIYFIKISKKERLKFKFVLNAALNDAYSKAGNGKGIYFNMDLYVAQKIYQNNPIEHIDVGSRIDGLVAHVASFREITVLDIRPFDTEPKNIKFMRCDLASEISDSLVNAADSVSSTFCIGHIGLGRYGDTLDPSGHITSFKNLTKILKDGGYLYLAVPIGPLRVEFNAHRVFSLNYLMSLFNQYFSVVEFSYVDDRGNFYENVELTKVLVESNCNCNYGAGIFILRKN
jgi:hypothetical protein